MLFAILMHADPARTRAMTAEERAEVAHRHTVLGDELVASGELLNAVALDYPDTTTTVRARGSTTGPVSADVPALTAYYVVDCSDAGRAAEIAERIVDFHVTAVEIRAIHDSFGLTDHR